MPLTKLSLLVVLWVACVAGTAVCSAASDSALNVLLIISDDLRTELGCYGSHQARTPRLDALAEDGVRFDRAYCQFPLCNPSRSSLLTGRRPTTIGVLGNRTWFGDQHPDLVSLPKLFRAHGYQTVRSGKIFHGGIDDADAWSQGGQPRGGSLRGTSSPRRDPASQAPATGLTKAQRSDRWMILQGNTALGGDHRVADRAIEYLAGRRADAPPFFLACGFSKPHSPLAAPQRFFDLFDAEQVQLPPDFAPRPTVPPGFPAGAIRPKNADLFIGRDATPQAAREMIRAYLASTAWMDFQVGRVLDALGALHLRERTIVVFWGDHGYQLGEKGKWSKAGSLWEQGTRVPLIIHDPRAAGNGTASPRVVETLDLYPTLVELCGLPDPGGLEGRSLAPLLEAPDSPWNHPAYTIWSEDGAHVTGAAVRTEHWRYAEYYGRGEGAMLLDEVNDPHELRNLVTEPAHSDVVARLSGLVREYTRGHLPAEAQVVRWHAVLMQPRAWYGSREAVRIAANVLAYQHDNGGWGKNVDMARALDAEQLAQLRAHHNETETMLDNGATHTQIRFLALVQQATGDARFAEASRRGIEYLLAAQYDNGGWPMTFPLKDGYYRHITFNDGSMIGAMRVLRDVAEGREPFGFVDLSLRERAAEAIGRGLDVILKCQVVVDGTPTVWCAQHDREDFRPRGARTYELASLSGAESVEIVRYLMELPDPSPAVRQAIEHAVAWFRAVKIEGWEVKTITDESLPRGYDRVMVRAEGARPLWARFYEIGTNRPMYVGRDGVVHDSLAQIEHERRVGYGWVGEYASGLLEHDYPAWQKRLAR
jgi:PelA/Pel-15E family pectate lyase